MQPPAAINTLGLGDFAAISMCWLLSLITGSIFQKWTSLVRSMQIFYKTFGGRRPYVEDNLQWKMTFGGRRPLVVNDLWWKTTFGGRWPSVEGDIRWKMTFGGRWPLGEDDLLWWFLLLTVKVQLSLNWNCYQLFQPESEFAIIKKCMRYLHLHAQVCRKEDSFRQRRLNHYDLALGGCTRP